MFYNDSVSPEGEDKTYFVNGLDSSVFFNETCAKWSSLEECLLTFCVVGIIRRNSGFLTTVPTKTKVFLDGL